MPSQQANLTVTVASAAALAVVAGALWFGTGASRSAPTADVGVASGFEARTNSASSTADKIRVHVSGAVLSPGVVELPADAIVADAVRAAGGASATADLMSINLASTVRGGERIVVPEFAPDGSSATGSGASGSVDSGIDLNTANASELESLPGVGPVLAERIVSFRDQRGYFDEVEDLLDVPGIGEAKLLAMRDAIARP